MRFAARPRYFGRSRATAGADRCLSRRTRTSPERSPTVSGELLMMTRSFVRFPSALGAVALILASFAAVPEAAANPEALVSEIGSKGIQVMGPQVPQQQRVAVFR